MKISKNMLFWCAVTFFCAAGCQSKKPDPARELLSINLLRGDLAFCGIDGFGEVNFSFYCNDDSREAFDLAVSLFNTV